MEINSLERPVTHTKYKGDKEYKSGKWSRILRKEINAEVRPNNKEEVDNDPQFFISVDDKFYANKYPKHLFPLQLTVLALLSLTVFLFTTEVYDTGSIICLVISLVILIFAIIYYFSTPTKETILNREEGTITFPGFWWQKNYTMPFSSVAFILSAPSRNMVSHKLQIIRPNSIFFDNSFAVDNCYKNLSFITWYLDKNRPLPTGTAFDPYHQRDFERRKAEGFPPPLYKSAIPTPEATPEQQKEREKYWKDYEHRPDPNNEDFAIPSI